MSEQLIIVDKRNRAIGQAEKYAVHAEGLLHRAFSIFLVDRSGRLLLQQRHPAKYHSGGLWANACCGHPRPGERTLSAAKRRLVEELGAGAALTLEFVTRYHTTIRPAGLIENEIVHVYFGLAPHRLDPNPEEVVATAWTDLKSLQADVMKRPERYAYWFRHYLARHAVQVEAGINRVLRSQRATHGRPPPAVRSRAAE